MADIDPNLVRMIAEQVMAAVRSASAGSVPVQVHAPIGTCTGDYSKFPELRGKVGAPGPSSRQLDGTSSLPPPPTAGGGVVHPSGGELYATRQPSGPDGTSALPPENAAGGRVAPDRHLGYLTSSGPDTRTPDGTSALPPQGGGATVQPSHAPITGQARSSGTAPDGTAALPPAVETAPVATSLKGVITAAHLRNIRGPVRLAKGAILTPLAQDFIRERNINVLTDELAPSVKVNGGSAPIVGGAPILWWIEGQCPSVAKLVEALRPNLLASRERGSADNLKNVVKELAQLVKGKKVAGGILFVPSAARAICYANRCQSLRAVVATNDRAVSEGIELLGANVLVVEYPPFGFKAMLALVKPFVESMQSVPAAVQRELDELRTCG